MTENSSGWGDSGWLDYLTNQLEDDEEPTEVT